MAEKYASKCEEIKTLEKIIDIFKRIHGLYNDADDLASKIEYKWIREMIKSLRLFAFMVWKNIAIAENLLEKILEEKGIECREEGG